jgi:phosphoesterase RecJ-like protein
MDDLKLQMIADRLKNEESIAILPHVNVDGDALGAALALALALRSLGKRADVIIGEEVPFTLDFLPGLECIVSDPDGSYGVAVNIDNGDITRLGERQKYYNEALTRLSIDHHATNRVDADISYLDVKASATGEIIYDLLTQYMNLPITKEIALCLYTAIITDTGGFRFANTTARTLEICASLMKTGIDFTNAIKKVFDTISYAKLYLMKQTMNSLRLMLDGKLAVSHLSYEDLSRFNAKADDTEGLVNIGRNLEGVEVSLFLREDRPGVFKGSLRSNEYVDVSRVAEKFGGGGHKRAAGFTAEGEIENITKIAIGEISAALAGDR